MNLAHVERAYSPQPDHPNVRQFCLWISRARATWPVQRSSSWCTIFTLTYTRIHCNMMNIFAFLPTKTLFSLCREFYGISDDFPFDQLMVRCEMGKKRNIYFVSSVVKKIVQDNEDRFKVCSTTAVVNFLSNWEKTSVKSLNLTVILREYYCGSQ